MTIASGNRTDVVPVLGRTAVDSVAVVIGNVPTHAHEAHQLVVTAFGVLVVGIKNQSYVTLRSRGLWIPAGVAHSVEPLGKASMTALWFNADRTPLQWREPTHFAMTGIIRSLIEYLASDPATRTARAHAKGLLFELLEPADLPSEVTIDVPMPRDDRARRVAEELRANPADSRTLRAWGCHVGSSERTLLRRFRVETGLGFHEWRTRIRVLSALPLLVQDLPVEVVAHRVGYASAPSFGAAFRRTTGHSPAAFARST